jgi:Cd2+/Zn2+-exporting ATPase
VVIALLTVVGLLAGVFADSVHMAGGMFIHQVSVLVVVVNGMRLMKRSRSGISEPGTLQENPGNDAAHTTV